MLYFFSNFLADGGSPMTKPKLANIENRSRLEIFAVVFFFFNLAFLLFRFYRTYIYGEGWT